jgi:hypothetical protein
MAFPIIPVLVAIGTIIATAVPKADDVARRRRIKELEGRRLGLADYEAEQLMAQGLSPAQAAEREFMMRQGDAAATQGMSGGQLLAQQQAGQERLLKARGDVSRQLLAQDAQRAAEERDELDRLLTAKGARQREVAAGTMSAVGSLAEPIAGYTDDMAIETREGVDNRYKGAPTGEGQAMGQRLNQLDMEHDWLKAYEEEEKLRLRGLA